jgi:hypothetical protein
MAVSQPAARPEAWMAAFPKNISSSVWSLVQTSPIFLCVIRKEMSDKDILDEAACTAAWRTCCLAGIGAGRASSRADMVARMGDSLAFTQAKEKRHV